MREIGHKEQQVRTLIDIKRDTKASKSPHRREELERAWDAIIGENLDTKMFMEARMRDMKCARARSRRSSTRWIGANMGGTATTRTA